MNALFVVTKQNTVKIYVSRFEKWNLRSKRIIDYVYNSFTLNKEIDRIQLLETLTIFIIMRQNKLHNRNKKILLI